MTKLKLTATLKDYQGNALSGKPIDFYYSYDGETYTKITTQSTDINGKAETTHETTRTTWYKARFEGDSTYDASEAVEKYEMPLIPPELMEQLTNLMMQLLLIMILMSILMALIPRRRE